jgi:hypothetical protein
MAVEVKFSARIERVLPDADKTYRAYLVMVDATVYEGPDGSLFAEVAPEARITEGSIKHTALTLTEEECKALEPEALKAV